MARFGPQLPLFVALAGTLLVLLPVMVGLRGYLERAQAAVELADEQVGQAAAA